MPKAPEKPPIKPLDPAQFVQQGVSDDQLILIGHAVVRWAWLEAAMQDALWALVGVPIDDGRILTQRTDASRKIQWLHAFAARHLDDAKRAELKAMLDDVELLQGDRNFIVHGSWATLMPDNVALAASVRERSDRADSVVTETFPEMRMVNIIDRIDKAKQALMAWREQHEASRGTLTPPKPNE